MIASKYCIARARVDINHVFCFTFGYVYYCIIPFVCFEWEVDFQGITYENLLDIYRAIPDDRVAYYIISVLLIYLCFILGAVCGKSKYRIIGPRVPQFSDVSFNFSQKVVYLIVIIMAMVILYFNRASLFRGYVYLVTIDSYDSMRVLMSAFEFIITICTLYYLNSNPHFSFLRKVFNKWTFLLATYSLILLTTGGRLYVITSMLSIVIFLSFSNSIQLRIWGLLIFGVLTALVMGLIGTSRLGFVGFDFKSSVFNVFEEPLYTNYSNLTYLLNYSPVNVICTPITLFSSVVNLLPTTLFPWKLGVIKNITDIYPNIEQPLGATHFYPSFNAGFGLILSMLLFYFVGKCLRRIHKSYGDAGITKRVIFCLVCANMAFSLFRDPVATSLIKNIVEFSVVMPWLISGLNYSIYRVVKNS